MNTEDKSGWVYILDDQLGHYKIGKTRYLSERIKQLKIQLPYCVTINYVFQTPDCHTDEKALHEKFKAKRINGEWFELEIDDLGALYDFAHYTGLYEWGGHLVRDPMFDESLADCRAFQQMQSARFAEEDFLDLASSRILTDAEIEEDYRATFGRA